LDHFGKSAVNKLTLVARQANVVGAAPLPEGPFVAVDRKIRSFGKEVATENGSPL
jgi:hypothetical protein